MNTKLATITIDPSGYESLIHNVAELASSIVEAFECNMDGALGNENGSARAENALKWMNRYYDHSAVAIRTITSISNILSEGFANLEIMIAPNEPAHTTAEK